MKENNWIDSPRITIVELTLKMEKSLNHDYRNNNGRNFQFTNSQLLTLSLSTEKVFQVNG